MKNNYFVGFDMGTDSLGWADTTCDYQPESFHGKSTWGVELFDAGKTAVETRGFRTSRRRIARKKQRIELLESLFAEEISKVDMGFFQRLHDSFFISSDKSTEQTNTLFNDEYFKDIDYYKSYKTIYHLRKALIEGKSEFDIRLVYLAIHHIIKNRGHFLFDLDSNSEMPSFNEIINDLITYLSDEYSEALKCDNLNSFSEILQDKDKNKTTKERELLNLCEVKKNENKQLASVIKSLCGLKVNLCDLYNDESLKDCDEKDFNFSAGFSDKEDAYRDILGDRYELLDKLRSIYDWSVLSNILMGEEYLSYAKVDLYKKHHNDLKLLKNVIKEHGGKKVYDEVFNTSSASLKNYAAYVGVCKKNGKKIVIEKTCTYDEFCLYIKKIIGKFDNNDDAVQSLLQEIDKGTLLPKQRTKDNCVIPYQVHLKELKRILANAENYLPFLSQKDDAGLSVSDKIISLFSFRIPYYVGPLNNHDQRFSWVVRTNEKITPWNFNEVVDAQESAEKFILRMTNKCTYLKTKDVLPKDSLLYSEFTVLNELNNLCIDGEKISVQLKQDIFNDLFKKNNKVTHKKLADYLKSRGLLDANSAISGIDGDFKSSLKTYRAFERIIDKYNDIEMVENIIRWLVLFGDDKKMLKSKIEKEYGAVLCAEDINYILRKVKCSGWGRFSKELLTEIYHIDKSTGEAQSVISLLRNTNDNFMQLIASSNYDFAKAIDEYNTVQTSMTVKQMVDELYISPAIKRPVLHTLKIANEIVKIHNGTAPQKIFIEMARSKEEGKGRTVSRKNKLLDLYEACREDEKELYSSLLNKDENEFKRDRLYLYYTQMGKCVYTGKKISVEDIYDENLYDVDHIFPQSKIKDDSLDNRVLVCRTANSTKSDFYPVPLQFKGAEQKALWQMLRTKELISKIKYDRLMRNDELSDDELNSFINRQLVETRQSTKAVAGLLSKIYPDTEIVYVKANTVSDFRRDNDFVKCREVNDLHHAKDAYLNIVVGNVYNERYTHNGANFIKGLRSRTFSLNKMFDYDTPKAWIAGANGSMSIVKNVMSKNNILFTRYATEQHGGFFDQNIVKKGGVLTPIKSGDTRLLNTDVYGGYKNAKSCYLCLVEHQVKAKTIRTIEPVYLYLKSVYEENPESYCINTLKLNNPKILIKKIKYNTLFCQDGFYMHLSGKSGDNFTCKPAMQLCVGDEFDKYIKQLSKFSERCKKAKAKLAITPYDKITKEENLALYEKLQSKFNNPMFMVKFKSVADKINSHKDDFINLSLEEQVTVLLSFITILHCNIVHGDLKLIDESANSGIVSMNKKIYPNKDVLTFKIVYQSPTGLFEQEIDLLSDDLSVKPRR